MIGGSEFLHIKNVLRMKKGDNIVLCLGDGRDLTAVITELGKTSLTAEITGSEESKAEPRVRLTLYQALLKGEKLELVVQKATELGAAAIVPFYSNFTVVRPDTAKVGRLPRVALEAAKQCGRAALPEIRDIISFDKLAAETAGRLTVFPCEHERGVMIGEVLDEVRAQRPIEEIAVIIGGEGGFSVEEYERLKAGGAKACCLGPRILRAETAAVAAVSLAMLAAGGMEL